MKLNYSCEIEFISEQYRSWIETKFIKNQRRHYEEEKTSNFIMNW